MVYAADVTAYHVICLSTKSILTLMINVIREFFWMISDTGIGIPYSYL
ncbi:22293_t:CDS:2 [Gigaspora rosea]|nr:22293_t:CDS:2 [Gigaspora rosea]